MNLSRQPMAEYLALPRTSCGELLDMRRSPAFARYNRLHPRPETDALRLGSVWHCLSLEPETFGERFVTAEQCAADNKSKRERCTNPGSLTDGRDWFCRVRGHAPLQAAAPTLSVVSAEQISLAGAMAESLRADPGWRELVGDSPQCEVTSTFEKSGIPSKARADVLPVPRRGVRVVVDLKSLARPERVVRSAEDLGLDVRAAWYCEAFEAQSYVIAAVGSTPPHEVFLYAVDGWWFEQGETKLNDLWSRYRDCYESGVWPGGPGAVMSLPEPAWRGGAGVDFSGLDEEGESNAA